MDPSGAVVPAVELTLLKPDTGIERTAQSDGSGTYRFQNLPVGKYTLTVRADGFAPATLNGLEIGLNRTVTQNVQLEVTQVATEVVVQDTPAPLDGSSAAVGSVYERRFAANLPAMNITSGVLNLSLLSAGVATSGGLGVGEGPAVGGQRPRQNNFMIEGIDNNRKDTTGSNVQPSNEAVLEFSTLQNQFTAEFGRSTGGQFNTVLKSGGNQIHGSFYEYFRNRNLDAVDQSRKRQGILANPRYDNNRFGGTVGGPIQKNRLFYFGNLEYNPIGQSYTTAPSLSPTASGYQMLGQMQSVSKTNLGVLQKYAKPAPAATGATVVNGVSIPIGIMPLNLPVYQNNFTWAGSIDYTLSAADQMRVRYIENRFNGYAADMMPNLPDFLAQRQVAQRMVSFSEYHTFSPTVLNEFRAAYVRSSNNVPAANAQYPGVDAFPNIYLAQDLNLNIGPFTFAPQSGIQNTYQVVNNTTWIRGRHTFKAGIDGRKYIAPLNFIQYQRGEYAYQSLERFLLDLNPDIYGVRNAGGVPYSGNSVDFYSYFQDEIKLSSRLTVNLGLRHEYRGVPASDKLQALNAASSVPGLIDFRAPRAQRANFAPRAGVAYSPGNSGRTVLRAGFGVAYDNYFDNLGTLTKPVQLENTIFVNPAENQQNFLANGGIRADSRPAQLSQASARAMTSSYIPDQHLPYSMQWNFGVQRQLGKDYTVEARYLGTRGVRLFVQTLMNPVARVTADNHLPTYLSRPSQAELDRLSTTLTSLLAQPRLDPRYTSAGFLSNITSFQNSGNSSYHGLAIDVTRRYAKGLLMKTGYTWSHAIDDSTAEVFSTLINPRRAQDFRNRQAEKASSFLDRRHRLTMAWFYDTPWYNASPNWFLKKVAGSWNFSGVYTAESPQYATVQSGLDANLNGDSAGDRVIVNPAGRPGTGSGVETLKNSSGQTVGYLALDPTAQYIRAGQGAWATGGRNTLPIRGINNFDVTIGKTIPLTEARRFEFHASFVNALNHPQYVPGRISSVYPQPARQTNNHLIPGNPLFNDPTRVYDSNARILFLTGRFIF